MTWTALTSSSGTSRAGPRTISSITPLWITTGNWWKQHLYIYYIKYFRAFLECMLEQVQHERSPTTENLSWEEALRPNKVAVTSVSLKNWLNMWSRLLSG